MGPFNSSDSGGGGGARSRKMVVVRGETNLPGLSTVNFGKESYCMEYVEQNC